MKKTAITSRILTGFLVFLFALFGLSSTFLSTASAWNVGACTYTNFNGAAPDQVLLASNGDVVTTNKWNAFVCNFVILGELIYGASVTDRKQSVFNFHSNPTNSLGSSVSEIRLPTEVAGSSDPNIGGYIGFYDAAGSYTTNTVKSVIASVNDAGGRGGMGLASLTPNSTTHLYTKWDNVRDAQAGFGPSPGLGLRRHALAWEGVPTSDTANFDTKCQYRIVAGPGEGWVLYFSAVSGNMIRGQFNSSMDGSSNMSVSLKVDSNSKNIYRVFDQNGLTPASSGAYGNGTVTHLEKLCLPVYNP